MARLLKQSTAFTFRVGPFLDDTDGKTAETGLTIAQADMQISKNGGAFAQTSDAAPTTTHDADGWYQCPLTTTDTDTLGAFTIQIGMAGALPVWEHFIVVPANVFDSLVAGSETLNADVTEWLGTAAATPTVGGVPEVDVTHWLGTGVSAGTAGIPSVNTTAIFNNILPALLLERWLNEGKTSTADSGTTTTLVDTSLSEADDLWNGALLVFTNGTNNGYTAIVTDFDAATDTLTFTPAVPNAVTTEDFILLPGLGHANVQAWLGTPATLSTGNKPDVNVDEWADVLLATTNPLPNAAADAAGGLPISDAGGLDVDSKLANTNEITVARMAELDAANLPTDVAAIITRGDIAWITGSGAVEKVLLQSTTIATLASQTSFTLTAGSADDDAYNDALIVIEDVSTATQKAIGLILDYTGSSKTVTLAADPGIFTMAATDKVAIIARHPQSDTTRWNGTAVATPDTAGLPKVTVKEGLGTGEWPVIRDNTAQAGAAATITLDGSASATDDLYKWLECYIYGGTGLGQSRPIVGYVGSTKVATISPDWVTNPDATSTFKLRLNPALLLVADSADLDDAGSLAKLIADKLALITSSTTLATNTLFSDGDVIILLQGESKEGDNRLRFEIDGTTAGGDLTGFTPRFGITKITTNIGTGSLEITGALVDAGLSTQHVLFALTQAQTAALALSPGTSHPFFVNKNEVYAYTFTFSAFDAGTACPSFATGHVDVKKRDTTCA